ncbi:MAG: hypothetical protein KDI55_26475, partial [Anaerolineae bacterium]|nr:hypothetical protein [Anaerolineae bacterium]
MNVEELLTKLTLIGVYISIASAIVEVALNVVFESKAYVRWLAGKGLKVPIAIVTSFAVAKVYGLDVVSYALTPGLGGHEQHWLGWTLTGL